jgi:DNA-binding response OmpR family regulator
MTKILLIEDDINLGTTLMGALEMMNYKVRHIFNGDTIIKELADFQPELVLLDVNLNTKLDGFDIGKLIREKYQTPIIFTTSRDESEDLKTGFSIANTDYVRKPYRVMEIEMRIKNLLSKQTSNNSEKENTFQFGDFSFYPDEHSIKYEGNKFHLNNYETAVLELLCQHKDTFMSKQKIIELVWNCDQPKLKTGALDNVLSNLRKYLKPSTTIELECRVGLGVKLTTK